MIGLFSILGLALAVIGIYGVLAESVAERVPEIGVRIAPGAQPSNVGALILRHGIWMIAIGLGLGFAGALIVTRQIGATVFGVSTLDPLSYVVALDPVVALRSE